MRMSCWTPDIVRFMEDADRLSPYFGELAAIAARECPQGGRVLDAGCGMGQLSLALASHAGHVDAVDRNEDAVAHLARRAHEMGVANVRPICADMFVWRSSKNPDVPPCTRGADNGRLWPAGTPALPHARPRTWGKRMRRAQGTPYDLAIFCLSASFEDAYAAACRLGARGVLVINKIHAHNPYEPRPVVDDFEAALERNRQIDPRARGMHVRLDYGQPLHSLEDAVTYFSLFRTRSYPHGVTTSQVEKLLERRGDTEFPYYLPVWRDLAVFACETRRGVLPQGLGCDGLWDATGAASTMRH